MGLLKNDIFRKTIFIIAAILCLTSFIDPPIALLMGFLLSLFFDNPFEKITRKATKYLLQISVVGLGFGMNVFEAAKAGKEGLIFTIVSISMTMLVGIFVGRMMSINKRTSMLISSGTAICGGSAIAAISPIIEAKEEEISVSLGTIFILNSLALFIFPIVGHLLSLSQGQFGVWAAIAIHDTSSVVGAAHKFGEEALKIATTIKLERALWIIPISFIVALVFKNKKSKIKIPYFIFLFVIAMLINTFIPQTYIVGQYFVLFAKKGLTLTLFLIGAGLTIKSLKTVGVKPLILGVLLWVLISTTSLLVITAL